MRIEITLPRDRTQPGRLVVFGPNGTQLGSFPALGKADNQEAARRGNPTRNPLRPFGDTPTGTWSAKVGKVMPDTSTYGLHPVIYLWPTGGDALTSHSPLNRRTGIWLHGGSLGAAGQLRPTYGCIRVHDGTMARLHGWIRQYGPITNLEIKES